MAVADTAAGEVVGAAVDMGAGAVVAAAADSAAVREAAVRMAVARAGAAVAARDAALSVKLVAQRQDEEVRSPEWVQPSGASSRRGWAGTPPSPLRRFRLECATVWRRESRFPRASLAVPCRRMC